MESKVPEHSPEKAALSPAPDSGKSDSEKNKKASSSAPASAKLSPMMKQYREIKSRHKDAVLFFRMGDFYEMFYEDALHVCEILDLVLTQRSGVPMCGLPYHAAKNYIARLLQAGEKIAVCEQVEIPPKGLAKREVVEVITPGTVVDDSYLNKTSNNYLAAMGRVGDRLSFAYTDLSTGEFRAGEAPWEDRLFYIAKELCRLHPQELILPETFFEDEALARIIQERKCCLNQLPEWSFNLEESEKKLLKHFRVQSLKGFGFAPKQAALLAPGLIVDYLSENSLPALTHMKTLSLCRENDFLHLDEVSQKTLELTRNMNTGRREFSLLDVLDKTCTPPGARNLRQWILRPPVDLKTIKSRQDRVEALYKNQLLLSQVREQLKKIPDLERLASLVAMNKANARHLLRVKQALRHIEILIVSLREKEIPEDYPSEELRKKAREVAASLEAGIAESPSHLFNEGNLIKEGYNRELDELRYLQTHSRKFLEDYLEEERSRSGITKLRVRYNKVIGYFFEVSKGQVQHVPEHFMRRQTLVNTERYTTEKLTELEVRLNASGEERVELERKLFFEIRESLKEFIGLFQDWGQFVGRFDCFQSLAFCATEYRYTRPLVNNSGRILIKNGRHPVVERHLPPGEFIPNDSGLEPENKRFALVTGPNMAGKSTYLRQTALLTLMAQMGSFIPAEEAEIGIVDKIFCRVGASDNLSRGESTFLVEMQETSNILRNAGPDSLIIMDEVGRGTGTDDGLSIARSVAEYILKTLKARTLFATHYKEMTRMKHPSLWNVSFRIREENGQPVFLRKLVEEPAESSYGIYVAALAGIPQEVIERAEALLFEFKTRSLPSADSVHQAESRGVFEQLKKPRSSEDPQSPQDPQDPRVSGRSPGRDKGEIPEGTIQKEVMPQETILKESRPIQPSLFDRSEEILDELKALSLENISPLEAFQILLSWKEKTGKNGF